MVELGHHCISRNGALIGNYALKTTCGISVPNLIQISKNLYFENDGFTIE